MENHSSEDLAIAQGAVLVKSCEVPSGAVPIRGYDFNQGIDFQAMMQSYLTTGFQASHLGKAIQQVNMILDERERPLPENSDISPFFPYPEGLQKTGCTIFLGYTSNLVSSGIREVLRFVVQHNLVDCIVTSAGGIEEDLIKCLRPSYLGAFNMDGHKLRSQGMNRAGNVLIPNDNYCAFEDWLNPILDACLKEQEEKDFRWTPSKLIHRLGAEIKNEDSILYWASVHNIPVFCPALTDGSLGDMLYFHSVSNALGIRLDIVEDVRHINTMAVKSVRSDSIILGGDVVKHHINNANLMRNGSDYTVYINTGMVGAWPPSRFECVFENVRFTSRRPLMVDESTERTGGFDTACLSDSVRKEVRMTGRYTEKEFDGSDSGAQPDEAVSWGK